MRSRGLIVCLAVIAFTLIPGFAEDKLVRVDLTYQAPGAGPKPNFSPYGTPVMLSDYPAGEPLPEGAGRPAKVGLVHIGPDQNSWVRILATGDAAHRADLCRLYLYRYRGGDFSHLDQTLSATPSQNEKTKAWWTTFNGARFDIQYPGGAQLYQVDFWAVRESDAPPNVIRYSVRSWRAGKATIDGVEALVAMMDSNNDAIFDAKDTWSVLAEAEPQAATRVLSYKEARPTKRLMFLTKPDGKQVVLEFREASPDGRKLTLAVVDRAVTKEVDRAPDDTLAAERVRPRAQQPFPWIQNDLFRALSQAKQSGRYLIVDYWTSWCGPCHSLDEWIWTDAEVAGILNRKYVGVKMDGDLDRALAAKFRVEGYPAIIVLDPSGHEIKRMHYLGSKEMAAALQ